MFLIPAPGLVIRDPENMRPLPILGSEVPETEYWLRRVLDGDAILSTAPIPSEDVAPQAAKKNSPTVPADTGSVS